MGFSYENRRSYVASFMDVTSNDIGNVAMIEGLHTAAHWHQEIDVHGICRQNKEYIEMREQEEDDW